MKDIINNIKVSFKQIFYWTNSSIVLHWIQSNSRDYKQFVGNRIGQIQKETNPKQWRHVPTNDNPADIILRGISPKQLIDNDLWWHGPPWLLNDQLNWPSTKFNKLEMNIPEKKTVSLIITDMPQWDIYNKFSNLHKLVRVFAYCRRFIRSLNPKKQDET